MPQNTTSVNSPENFLARHPDLAVQHLGDETGISGDILRSVDIGHYRLIMWDTGKQTGNHTYIGYRFVTRKGHLLFQGTDIGIPQSVPIDSDSAVKTVLKFLTLRPGDTDEEYFLDYSNEQMAFAEGPAEEVSILADEGMFTDSPGYESTDIK